MIRSIAAVFSLWIPGAFVLGAPQSPSTKSEDIVGHLQQTIAWYHFVTSVANSDATEILQRDSVQRQALDATRLAFEFARAEVRLMAGESEGSKAAANPSPQTGRSTNLQQAASRAEDRVNRIQSWLQDADASLRKAPARTRPTLIARRSELEAEFGLAKEVQSTVQRFIRFAGLQESSGSGSDALIAEINQLGRSIPETMSGRATSTSAAPSAHSATPASAQVFHPESTGIFPLIAELLTLTRGRSRLDDAMRRTDELAQNIDRLRGPVASELKEEVHRSESLATAANTSELQQIITARQEIERLSARFKQLSTTAIPLGEQGIMVGSTRANLLQMRNGLSQQYGATLRYLMLRLGVLAAAIGLVWIVSELWRRATFRFIGDPRRRRQFLVLRRVVVLAAITLVFVLSFVSEFGSLATYAGLLTAGIAVALQNVILAVVAYFFLIGRHGVRIGDRVTISGVTGNVVELGLVRIYLMELLGTGAELHPTGRIVVFSNSVIFQPSAMFKQLPGIDYVWHTVKLELTADSDRETAQKLLSSAVESVYQEYRHTIEQQHAAFERAVQLQLSAPRPECRLRFTENKLEVFVNYPVPLKGASHVDDSVMKQLYEEILKEPKLHLVSAGVPQLQTT
jgi:small-conductance mechanosensitive channel